MNIDDVLKFPSFSKIRRDLKKYSAEQLLKAVHHGYAAFHCPKERKKYLEKKIKAEDILHLNRAATDDWVHSYVKGLTHAIYVEQYLNLPWSLKDYSQSQLDHLLFLYNSVPSWDATDSKASRGCFERDMCAGTLPGHKDRILFDWYMAFPLSYHLIKNARNHAEALEACVVWVMSNFFHAAAGWDWSHYKKYGQSIGLDDLMEERIIGCHEGAKILVALLRSINIPAIEVHYAGHGICYVPTLQRFVHGDYLADFVLLEDVGKIIQTKTQLLSWLKKPKGYLSHHSELWNKDKYGAYTLWRKDKSLHYGNSYTRYDQQHGAFFGYATDDLRKRVASLKVRLPQYGFSEVNGKIYSTLTPLLGIDRAISCGLVLYAWKDSATNLVIAVENRGCNYPIKTAEIEIEIDDKHAATQKLSPWLDNSHGFMMGGMFAKKVTNIKIKPDEHGVVLLNLKKLKNSEHQFSVFYHLGKPFEIDNNPFWSSQPSTPLLPTPRTTLHP